VAEILGPYRSPSRAVDSGFFLSGRDGFEAEKAGGSRPFRRARLTRRTGVFGMHMLRAPGYWSSWKKGPPLSRPHLRQAVRLRPWRGTEERPRDGAFFRAAPLKSGRTSSRGPRLDGSWALSVAPWWGFYGSVEGPSGGHCRAGAGRNARKGGDGGAGPIGVPSKPLFGPSRAVRCRSAEGGEKPGNRALRDSAARHVGAQKRNSGVPRLKAGGRSCAREDPSTEGLGEHEVLG